MNWTCEQIEAQLTEYLDGALPTEVQAGFDAHVASCAHCAVLVQTVRGMVSAMHALEPVPVPPGLMAKILEQTSGSIPPRKIGGHRGWAGRVSSSRRDSPTECSQFLSPSLLSRRRLV